MIRPFAPLMSASIAAFLLGSVTLAGAQVAPGCDDVRPILEERQKIITEIGSWKTNKSRQIDLATACVVGRRLVSNGDKLLGWLKDNKEWCSIPDQFVAGIQNDHKQSQAMRINVCRGNPRPNLRENQSVAGERNPLGAGGLSGQRKIPQGAL